MKKLTADFFKDDTVKVARGLIGKYLVTEIKGLKTVGRIVETEAYCGVDDPACHVYKGKMTDKSKILFAEPGCAYVYLIYGIHYCFNVVSHREGEAGGVFIRALEPIKGIENMMKRHKVRNAGSCDVKKLSNGPSKLCIAMGIDKSFYGEDLCGKKAYILEGEKINTEDIITASRINIEYAGRGRFNPWRFVKI